MPSLWHLIIYQMTALVINYDPCFTPQTPLASIKEERLFDLINSNMSIPVLYSVSNQHREGLYSVANQRFNIERGYIL